MIFFGRRGVVPQGLSLESVGLSRSRHGENVISQKKRKGFWGKLLESFGDPLIKILLIALGINVVFLFKNSEWYETAVIAAAILVATIVSTVSEMGSEAAFKRLQSEAAKTRCKVIRGGVLSGIPVGEAVVGDLIKLQAGDKIPADGYLFSGKLEVDQSTLNGETKEAKKEAAGDGDGLTESTVISLREASRLDGDFNDKRRLFCGTVVCSGDGIMRVTAVGDKTFYGGLAGELQEAEGSSPMKERLKELAKSISRFGYIGAALVAAAYLFNVIAVENSFDPILIKSFFGDWQLVLTRLLYAVTLAVTVIVMAVPEGLPMMITVVLTSNMKKMMKDNVIVRKLVGIETAGSLNVLFCDKTGTLTGGRPEVSGFIDGDGAEWKGGDCGIDKKPLWTRIYTSLFYNNSASLSNGLGIGGNSTDRALIEYACRHAVKQKDGLKFINIVPFSSELKYMATEIRSGGGAAETLIKGAPEVLLPHCREYIDADGKAKPLTKRRLLENRIAVMQGKAFRLIAVAVADGALKPGCFENLKLIGILSIRDDIRREAREGVKQIKEAGIQIVMITGDAKRTAEAIASEIGLFRGVKNPIVLTSDELAKINDGELKKLLPDICVIARALPSDKSRLVKIAQSAGLVAGMTGDGVNDAPALKKADVSFGMGSGTEVAKEASDIVIADDNLLSIAKAVRYGRTIFKSIRKFIIFQLTLNFCAMGVSMVAPFFGITSPITIIQILWINMVMDTLAGLAFGGEAPLMKYMKETPKRRGEKIINKYMWLEILLGGASAIGVCLWFLNSGYIGEVFYYSRSARFYTAFFGLFMFMGIFNAFCARTHSLNLADHLAANKPFIIIMGAVTVAQIAILYFGGSIFRTDGLSLLELALIICLSLTAVASNAVRKAVYRLVGLKNNGV
ncbi:MAG: cation-translocating P-type ATPase [Clostridiales bacterium]|jgi:calcium-translocating P-type ATPase|nr:cation-translocating P-type ATPase [Clostridiales bacterium]